MSGVYQIPLVIGGTPYYVGNNNFYTGDMVTGPDGKIWVTGGTSTSTSSYNTIFQIDPATGSFNYYVPSGYTTVGGIISDGTNLWFSGFTTSGGFTWSKMNTSGTILATYSNSSYFYSYGTYSFDGTYIWWNYGGSSVFWFNTTTHVYGQTTFVGISNLSSLFSDGTNVWLGFNVNNTNIFVVAISWLLAHTGTQSLTTAVAVPGLGTGHYVFDWYYDGTTVWVASAGSQINAINASTFANTVYSSFGTINSMAYGIITDATSVWLSQNPNAPTSYSPVGTYQLSKPPTSIVGSTNYLSWNAKTLDPLGYVWMNNKTTGISGVPVGGVITNRFISSGNPIVMII
jgi:hypothetical protein